MFVKSGLVSHILEVFPNLNQVNDVTYSMRNNAGCDGKEESE